MGPTTQGAEQQLEWLSTTGGPHPADHGLTEDGEQGPGAVVLSRAAGMASKETSTLPMELHMGAGWPDAATVGRNEDNDAVLALKAASKVHCQFALRSFHLPGLPGEGEKVHEAMFLRDVSKNKTLVNGRAAYRPWHWLQDGDSIGLHADSNDPEAVLDFFKVRYFKHVQLPGNVAKTSPGDNAEALKAPRGRSNRHPAPASRAAATTTPGAAVTGSGGPSARANGKVANQQSKHPRRFGDEVCGRVVDITYVDESETVATYRMRIISYDKRQGWHNVDSEGLSKWENESFTDVVDINKMFGAGQIKFVEDPQASGAAKPQTHSRTPRKKAKTQN